MKKGLLDKLDDLDVIWIILIPLMILIFVGGILCIGSICDSTMYHATVFDKDGMVKAEYDEPEKINTCKNQCVIELKDGTKYKYSNCSVLIEEK